MNVNKKSIIIGLFLSAILLGFNSTFAAVDTVYGNSTIRIQISAVTMIDITPARMDWGTMNPGSVATRYNATNSTNDVIAEDLTGFQVENIGSKNITTVWFNNTVPSLNPFGPGLLSNYDPANWIMIKNNNSAAPSTQQQWKLINKVEYNASKEFLYLQTAPGARQGKLRLGDKEYFFAYNKSAASDWNATASGNAYTLRIGLAPHNSTDTGDINLGDGCDGVTCEEIQLVDDAKDYYVGKILVTSGTEPEFNDTCIALMDEDVTDSGKVGNKLMFYNWNSDIGGDQCNGTNAYFGSTYLVPGDSLAMNIKMAVPYGVPNDASAITGTLRVVAESVA